MIALKRDGKDVVLSFDADIPFYDTRRFEFTFHTGQETYAGLLTSHLREKLGDAMEAARREAYEKGWTDAKAKRTKDTWFRRNL